MVAIDTLCFTYLGSQHSFTQIGRFVTFWANFLSIFGHLLVSGGFLLAKFGHPLNSQVRDVNMATRGVSLAYYDQNAGLYTGEPDPVMSQSVADKSCQIMYNGKTRLTQKWPLAPGDRSQMLAHLGVAILRKLKTISRPLISWDRWISKQERLKAATDWEPFWAILDTIFGHFLPKLGDFLAWESCLTARRW